MGIFKKSNLKRNLIIAAAVIILAVGGYFLYAGRDKKPDKKVFARDGKKKDSIERKVGVVDYQKLVVEHPDFEKLKNYNREIAMLQRVDFDPTRLKTLYDEAYKKIEKFKNSIEGTLKKEMKAIQAENQRKIEAIKSELNVEYRKKHKEFMEYKQKLEKEYVAKRKDPNRKLSKWEKEFASRVRKYSSDLVMLKERQVAAKRLELQRKSQGRLLAVKNRLNKELSDYEDQVKNEFQNDKLNLQLKLQVAKDDKERRKIQEKLSKIHSKENQKVDAKRKELALEYKKAEDEENTKNTKLLKKYKAKLDLDVGKQIGKIQDKVQKEMIKEGIKRGETAPHVPKELRSKLEARRKKLTAEMKVLDGKLKSRIRTISQASRQKFEERKKELVGKLNAYKDKLQKEVEAKKKKMLEDLQAAGAQNKKTAEKLMENRDNLRDRMIRQINEKVEKVAREKGIDFVVGQYLVNVKGEDLNEEAIQAVRNIGREKPADK